MQYRGLALIASLALGIGLSGCAAVTVQPQHQEKLQADTVDYAERKNFFFWGLVGEHRINVAEICPAGAKQMQSIFTVEDVLFSVVTLGIYSPRTAKVWCAPTTVAEVNELHVLPEVI